MGAWRLLVFVMVVVISLHETICGNMNKNVYLPLRMLEEQRAHKSIKCQEVAREALFEFFNKGFDKTDLDRSLDFQENPDDCCLWSGGGCDALGSVVSLSIWNVDATSRKASISRDNSLSGEFPEGMQMEISFGQLDLSQNCLSGAIPSYLNSWDLGDIDLSSNNFSGRIPSSFCHYGSHNLQGLRLANNLLNGSIPHGLGHCPYLFSLVLRNNLLTGFIPASIGHLSSTLQMLDLANNHLRGSIPTWLQQMQSLRVLSLDYNHLTGFLPSSPWNTTQLQVLGLSHNHLRGSIPAENLSALLQGFFYNSTRNTADNTFYEEIVIPAKGQSLSFEYILEATVSLDLSYNNLQGPIPPALGSLNGLVFLNLSHNHLNGNIPESLGNLTQLNSLDLSNNELEGGIPDALCNLTFLEVANLSNNQLKGMIPQCQQWSTFNSSSFQGNGELCGSQISLPCRNENVSPGPVPTHEVDSKDNDFLLAVIVGVCISFPVVLLLTFYWAPIRQPTIMVSQRILTKLKRL